MGGTGLTGCTRLECRYDLDMRSRLFTPDWLYGQKFPSGNVSTSMMLRNLLLDVDTLFDLEQEVVRIIRDSGILVEASPVAQAEPTMVKYNSVAQYRLRGEVIPRDRVLELGVPDRNQLELTVQISMTPTVPHTHPFASTEAGVSVASQYATVALAAPSYSEATQRIMLEIGRYLYRNATQIPDWRAARALFWLSPIPIAVAAWIWLMFTVELALPFHVLIFAVLVLASFSSVTRVATEISTARQGIVGRSFQYRGESRKETHRRRADAKQNLKAVLYSAPISIAIGVIGTLFAVAVGK